MTRTNTDLLRVFSTFAVICIHATAFWEWQYLAGSRSIETFIGIFLNQASRFAVPVFFILSGFALTKSYKSEWWGPEFLTRISRILIPYLVLSLIYLPAKSTAARNYLLEGDFISFLGDYLQSLLHGNADYHLYFLTILLQLYLIFPILNQGIRKLPQFICGLSLILLFLWQLSLTMDVRLLLRPHGIELPGSADLGFYSWLFYFFLGMYSAKFEVFRSLQTRTCFVFFTTLALAGAAGLSYQFLYFAEIYSVAGNFDHFNRASVVLFSIVIWFWFGTFQWPKALSSLSFLSSMSFGVYLIHTWINRAYYYTIQEYLVLKLILVTGISLGLIVLLHRITPKTSFFRKILGL